ncbi:MAG TPA: type IV pilus assembly protein PilM [Candidatus Bathyarchaeia archaeon]|nr:type IV pilus assembly protein PilM [Candidatus Bathyarchaeia archaeon]
MFGIFSKKNRCLGIDLGTTGIKIIELKKENNLPVFVNYAISYDSGSLLQSKNLELLDGQVKGILGKVLKEGNFGTKNTVIGIPGFFSLIFFIELPEMPEAEIERAVKFEATKYIPTPIDEVSLGWEMIGSVQEKAIEGGQLSSQGKKMQVMVVSVPKSTAVKYGDLVKSVKLSSKAIEVENFAVTRALIGNDKGTFMIVNIGAKATDFTVVSDGVVRVTRNIDVGGVEISRSVASGFGIDLDRADKLKKSSRVNLLDPHNETTPMISPVVGVISEEIKRLREIYHKKSPLKKIEKIIFTGGTSKMNTLVDFFGKETGMECQKGNSLARIGLEKKQQAVVEEVSPELSVAVGLAMRGLEIE